MALDKNFPSQSQFLWVSMGLDITIPILLLSQIVADVVVRHSVELPPFPLQQPVLDDPEPPGVGRVGVHPGPALHVRPAVGTNDSPVRKESLLAKLTA